MKPFCLPGSCRWTLSLGAVLLLGCHRHEEHAHDDHDHEPKTAQVTAWGEQHEVFAEHRLPVAGQPVKWITHVTDLRTAAPRRTGAIRFVLSQDGSPPIEQVEKEPVRAGIYEPVLRFPKAGGWQVSVSIPTETGERTVALPAVQVYAKQHDADHGEAAGPPEGITFLKEQQWKVLAKSEPAARRPLVERVRVPATVAERPGGLARVTAPIAGRVLPVPGRALPGVGARVEAGQTLALLQPVFSELSIRMTEAEAEVIRARLAAEQAELDFQRVEKLAAAEAKSGRELQEASFALKTARARLTAAQALQAAYHAAGANPGTNAGAAPALELKAAIGGIITESRRQPAGEHVPADTLLFTVLDASRVFIEAVVPESRVSQLATAAGASYEQPGEPGKFVSLSAGQGRLILAGLQVDPATRTVPFIFEAANDSGALRLGQMVNLHLETRRVAEALGIPLSALVEEGGLFIAYVQVGGETFQKRELRLGLRDHEWVQVLAGIEPGERVVTHGAQFIRLAAAAGVIPAHGHAH